MITIFTPTYNRGYIINSLAQSLIEQSKKNFEWLIIDDGSTDNTDQIINLIKSKCDFPVRYYKKKNEGKHIAINYGSELARGDWFFIVDSDDHLPPDSIEIIEKYIAQIEDKSNFAGVAGLKIYSQSNPVGGSLNKPVIDATAIKFRRKYSGDKAEVVKTSIIRKYKFPKFKNENFMQESVLWYGIAADGYLFRWFNEGIYVCDYLPDGLTKNGKKIAKKNPLSRSYADNQIIGLSGIKLKEKCKSAINYIRYGRYGGRDVKSLLATSHNKVLTGIFLPVSLIMKIKA